MSEEDTYVTVGPKGFSVNMEKETLKHGLIALLIFLGIAFIIVIAVGILVSRQMTTVKPKYSKKKHESRYTKLNLPQNFTVSVLDTKPDLNERQCERQCTLDRNCSGFFLGKGECTLFENDFTVQGDGSHTDQYLFLKNRNSLQFEDKIFLSRYGLPKDFWTKKSDNNFVQVEEGEVVKLDFVPTVVKTTKARTGVYTRHNFSLDDLNLVLTRESTYVHQPGTQLQVPWKDAPIFVTYVQIE